MERSSEAASIRAAALLTGEIRLLMGSGYYHPGDGRLRTKNLNEEIAEVFKDNLGIPRAWFLTDPYSNAYLDSFLREAAGNKRDVVVGIPGFRWIPISLSIYSPSVRNTISVLLDTLLLPPEDIRWAVPRRRLPASW